MNEYNFLSQKSESIIGEIKAYFEGNTELEINIDQEIEQLTQILKCENEEIKKILKNQQISETQAERYFHILSKKYIELYIFKAVFSMKSGNLELAKVLLLEALELNDEDFDVIYNLGFIYEILEDKENSIIYYEKAYRIAKDNLIKEQIKNKLIEFGLDTSKKKLVFFVKEGMDAFLGDILTYLSKIYLVKKQIVKSREDIEEGMKWADVCWFEWCDELIVFASNMNLAKNKKILCRMHRYEVFTEYPYKVNWNNIDCLMVVAEHLIDILKTKIMDLNKKVKISILKNGVNLDKFEYKERTKGFNIAYVGYIHERKNPVLMLQIIKKLTQINPKHKLYIAGKFQDSLIKLYWDYQIKMMKLENNVFFEGWQTDINSWLQDKNYILSTSIHESFGYGIAEAMARGIKPIIHDFISARDIWDEKYLFSTVDEAIEDIMEEKYDSIEYRNFIEKNYSLELQLDAIEKILEELTIDIGKSKTENINIVDFYYEEMEIKFYLPILNDFIQSIIYENNSFYELGMLEDVRKRIGENKIIIDIGANIGNHSVFFSKVCKAKKVYSFEPQKNIFEILKKNIEINNLEKDVNIYNMGIGKEHNYVNIDVVNEENYGMSRIDLTSKGEVEINKLDNLILNEVDTVDMIKIDVEGMEIDVLEGSKEILKKYKPIIYIEAGTDEEFIEVSDYLQKYGYKPIQRFNATPTYLFI